MVAGIFETGVAVSLAVFLILVIAGQFPATSYIAPVQLSVIDPATLHAEAQAIDMQIQLANLSYQESTTTVNESTTATAPDAAVKPKFAATMLVGSSTATSTPSTVLASSTQTSTMSVDEALQQLSQ